MPVMDGLKFLDEIEIRPESAGSVIILTGYGDDDAIRKCFELGVSSFLRKPFNFYELQGTVRNLIAMKDYEDMLRTTREQIEIILQNTAEGLHVIDADANLVYTNFNADGENKMDPFFLQAMLRRENEFSMFRILNENHQSVSFEDLPVQIALRGEYPFPVILCFNPVSGEKAHFLIVKATPVFSAQQKLKYVVIVYHDVSDHKIMLDQLKRNNLNQEDFSKMNSKDLKSAFTGFSTYISLLQNEYSNELDDNKRQNLQSVKKNIENLEKLFFDLLDSIEISKYDHVVCYKNTLTQL